MHKATHWPPIIQGGMGIGVSNWRLARVVSSFGQVGTVSLVAIPHVAARRLEQGDKDMLRALDAFPLRSGVVDVLKYSHRPNRSIPMFSLKPSRRLLWLTVFAAFAEVWLAKEGHRGIVAANLLEEVQAPMLPTIFGALLGGVDAFFVGAGLPFQLPSVLDAFLERREATYRVTLLGGGVDVVRFDPAHSLELDLRDAEAFAELPLRRPAFLPIVSLDATANVLRTRTHGRIDGFIVEDPRVAGGHNPLPRGYKGALSPKGEPIYTERDEVDFARMRGFGLPFYIAGGWASRTRLREARALGAQGVQVGSLFALAEESGLEPRDKARLRRLGYRGTLVVRSDPRASPTGYPFQVAQLAGSVSDAAVYAARTRVCNIGYLRKPYRRENGRIGYRCPAEPEKEYLEKGGRKEDLVGRQCLCNNLLGAVGLGLTYEGVPEPPIYTLGQDVSFLASLMRKESDTYFAVDAIAWMLNI